MGQISNGIKTTVTLIFKKGNKKNSGNYRLVILTSVYSDVIKIIWKTLPYRAIKGNWEEQG